MSDTSNPDAFYVGLVMRGQMEAFAHLASRYLPVVRAIALAQVRNPEDADDLAQEALLKAYTSLGQLRDRNRFGAWLASIVRNLACSLQRSRQRHSALAPREGSEPMVEPDLAQREIYARVRTYIEELPPTLRETVLLHYFAGRKTREVALLTSVTKNAAEKRLSRARSVLGARILEELVPKEEQTTKESDLRKLMGLVAAAPPPWTVLESAGLGASPAATLTGGLVVAKKIAIGASLCILLALGIWGATQVATHTEEANPQQVGRIAGSIQETAPPTRSETSAAPRSQTPTAAVAEPTNTTERSQILGQQGRIAPALDNFPAGEIRGFVVDIETGVGVPGVVVSAKSDSALTETPYKSDPTDEKGAFFIPNLPPAVYNVQREKAEGYRADNPDIRQVTVTAEEPAEGLVFELTKGVTVSGRVVNEFGAGVGEAEIVVGGGDDIYFVERIKSEADGNYSFDGLTPTTHVWIHAAAPGLTHRPQGPLTIPDEGLENLTLTMSREAEISGMLVDGSGRPLPGYTISLLPEIPARVGNWEDVTDGSGRFRIGGVFAGTFQVLVHPTERAYTNPNRRVIDTVTVLAGSHTAGLRLVYDVQTDLVISGRVTDTFGEPMPGEEVGYIPSEAMSVSKHVLTDADGYYRIEGLAEGVFEIDVSRKFIHFSSATVVPAGTENLDFVIPRYTYLRGQVVQEDGNTPVTDFTVSSAGASPYYRLDDALSGSKLCTQTIHDPKGRFELDTVLPGELHVAVRAEGYLAAIQTVNITEGEPVEDFVVRLHEGGPLRGRIVNEVGEPIAKVKVYCRIQDSFGDRNAAISAEDGTFEIDAPFLGDFVLVAMHPDYAYKIQDVHVPQSGTVQMVLPWGGTVAGRVTLYEAPPPRGSITILVGDILPEGIWASPDSDGFYEVGPVPAGEYELAAWVPPDDATKLFSKSHVQIQSGRISQVDFDFLPGTASIVGDIKFEMPGGIQCSIALSPIDGSVDKQYEVMVKGNITSQSGVPFQIGHVFPGRYRVEANSSMGMGHIHYAGEIEVPAEGEVRHDIVLQRRD